LSAHFDLHLFNRSGNVRNGIIAEYDISGASSRRNRQPHEQQILDEHHRYCHVYELTGALSFGVIEYLSRRLVQNRPDSVFIILDFRRVPTITKAAARLFADTLGELTGIDTTVILSGIQPLSPVATTLSPLIESLSKLRKFAMLDEAIEWAEDQIIYRYGGYEHLNDPTTLREQALFAGLTDDEIEAIATLMKPQSYQSGQRIVESGELASSVFFLQSGMVSVKLPDGVRLATLAAGMVFGEMGLLEENRSADVWADTSVQCLELPLDDFAGFREKHPQVGERIIRNLAVLLAKRLILVNTKIELLTSY
jgi:glutaminase